MERQVAQSPRSLGLVRRSSQGGLVIANPIYREVIPTVLATNAIAVTSPGGRGITVIRG